MNSSAPHFLKLKLAAALWLMAVATASAQTALEAWVQRYDNIVDAIDGGRAVITDSAGNVIVAGYTDDAVNGQTYLILKYSGAGVPLWTNRYQGSGNLANAVAVDSSGNVFVTGPSWNGSSDDYVTLAYSAAGARLWTNRYEGPGNSYDQAHAVAVDANGDVFVTGWSADDYVTIKYSGGGVPLWTNRVPGSYDQPNALAVDASGNVFVTGRSSGDYLTIKYSGAGVPLWTNRYDGPGNGIDSASSVEVDASGNVFVTGGAYVGPFGSDVDYATIKYSGAGVPLWTNYYNGPGDEADHALAVAVDGDGNVFVTGYSDGGGGNLDYATVAYSSDGALLWENRYDGPQNGYDAPSAIAVDNSGKVFVTGSSATIAYSWLGVTLWTNAGPAAALAVDGNGGAVVTGGLGGDCVTIKYSGAGALLWTNCYNGPAHAADRATAIAVDGSGNVLVTGESEGNNGQPDYATVKYSSAGFPLWTNRYDGSGDGESRPRALAVDGTGNVFVTGSAGTVAYSSAGTPLWTNHDQSIAVAVDHNGSVFVSGSSPGSGSGDDYTTIKYSSAGVALWTNRYNGPANGNDYAQALVVDASGNVVVAGYSSGSRGYDDYATAKYSSAGVPLWTNRYNGPADDTDEARAVAVDGAGNVFVTGISWNGTSYDYTTIKYSSAGVELWNRRYEGPGNSGDYASALVVDGNGNPVVTGLSYDGGSQCVTIKYSSAGVPSWTNRLAAAQDEPSIAVDSNGNVVVTGVAFNGSNSDYVTIAYSSAGVPLWTNRYNGPRNGNDEATAMAMDSSGNVFVTGSSLGGNFDYVTIKYSVATLAPIPLNYQSVGNELVLSWTNAAFSLQSAPAVQGSYTNVSGATSPYTNVISGEQRYFRLKGN